MYKFSKQIWQRMCGGEDGERESTDMESDFKNHFDGSVV